MTIPCLFSPSVDKLLRLGESKYLYRPIIYAPIGITEKDIPDLIQMATDPDLVSPEQYDSEDPIVWASLHAIRALGELQAAEAADPLLPLLGNHDDNDYLSGEVSDALGRIGAPSLQSLVEILQNAEADLDMRENAAIGIGAVAQHHSELAERCTEILMNQLMKYTENHRSLNGWIVDCLAAMKAEQAIPLIRQAYKDDAVDYSIIDWELIQDIFRLPDSPDDPPLQHRFTQEMQDTLSGCSSGPGCLSNPWKPNISARLMRPQRQNKKKTS